jgi:L-alanine-DL-glutamate epimerase-like enolase superfamily enzyme
MHPLVESVETAAYTVPTEQPEADGTLAWTSTTMVVVRVRAEGTEGVGWTYAPAACGHVIDELLAPAVRGGCAMASPAAGRALTDGVRNAGGPGLVLYAVSAVDVALWDLKARLLDQPLSLLLGTVRDAVPVYGSGGFTTYDEAKLKAQLGAWAEAGFERVKIKIGEDRGSNVRRDLDRVQQSRDVVGDGCELFVDANGAYARKQAIRVGRALEDMNVHWFEEPVSSDDKAGLALASRSLDIDITAGEYATEIHEFRRLCEVVDCLQMDASRCGGITGWLAAAAVADSFGLEVSGHCAPHLHLAVAAATPNLRHLEWFHDHVRIEQRFLDGAVGAEGGRVAPQTDAPGHGLTLKLADLEEFRAA